MRALTVEELGFVCGGFATFGEPENVVVPGVRRPRSSPNTTTIYCGGECGNMFEMPDFDALLGQFLEAATQDLCENLSEDSGAAVGAAVGSAVGFGTGLVVGRVGGGGVEGTIGSAVPGVGNVIGAVAIGSVAGRVASRYGAAAGAAVGVYLGKATAAGVNAIACPAT